jgi:hypothetical protein
MKIYNTDGEFWVWSDQEVTVEGQTLILERAIVAPTVGNRILSVEIHRNRIKVDYIKEEGGQGMTWYASLAVSSHTPHLPIVVTVL